ncbi:MAG TPA: PAS domain S-box protein [Dissulfurispiraceae bacterium]|nr:PAS domain S-box protein [Dissulfurispiraceae bacterium]
MKKRILIGLACFALIFFVAGIYIVITINEATSTLDRLIVLHQVEILREHLLLQIRKVQSDLDLKNTRYARGVDQTVSDVRNMEQVSKKCITCHHAPEVEARLHEMENLIDSYKIALSRVLTVQGDVSRMEAEEDAAFKIGDELVGNVNHMIALANINLEKETGASLRSIRNTKYVLYILVAVEPLLSLALAYIFISGFTKPIRSLLDATRLLKGGNLDHRIEGLRNEFGELADSFNDMAGELKANMKKLSDSEIRYRMLFESAGDAIFIIDAEGSNRGRIIAANKAASEIHGYSADEIIGMNIGDLDTPESANGVPERIEKMLRGEWLKEEVSHRRKDGTIFPVEISAGLLELDGRKYILAFDRDITARKQAEEALRQSEEKFSKAFRASPDWITISMIDDGRYIEVNDAFEQISGYRRDEVIGRTAIELGIWVDPKERQEIVEAMKRDGVLRNREVHFRTKSGTVLTMLRSSDIIDYGETRCMISVTRDITERRNAEIMMQRAEQMKAVGEVAVGLAHEIKNPLAGIKSSIEVLHDETQCAKEDRDVLMMVIREIRRIELMLKDLLNFARPPKPQLIMMDVNSILDSVLELSVDASGVAQPGLTLVREFCEELPPTLADPMQMKQVFLNLVLNAIDAMHCEGTLRVGTNCDKDAQIIEITISDTGKGIDKGSMDKLFHPFFTTKPRGTGLGLAISKRLVEENGGTITVRTSPGDTTFSVKLPVRKSEENV